MLPLRINTAVSLVLGAVLGGVAYHFIGPGVGDPQPCHDASYHVTPPIEQYYDRLRVEHIPAPPDYERGLAGVNYCLNWALWHINIQNDVSAGFNRQAIETWYLEMLDYEIAHDWLTRADSDRLIAFIHSAPLVDDIAVLGKVKYDQCDRERNPPLKLDSSV